MSLIPFNKHDKLASRPFTNFIDDFFGDNWLQMQSLANSAFKVDVCEAILHYTVEAELPGIKKEDIDISFNHGRLTISVSSAEEIEETQDKKSKYIHKERRYSSAQRSIYLDGATGEGITASLADGLLTVNVPKKDSGNEKKIEIK